MTGPIGLGLDMWTRRSGGGGTLYPESTPAAERSMFSMNLSTSDYYSTVRNYTNLAHYDKWQTPANVTPNANVNALGDIISVDGGSAYYYKTMGLPTTSGARVRITWTGAGAITLNGSGYSNVDTSTPNVIEYDHTFASARATSGVTIRATGPVSNLYANEVGGSTSKFRAEWLASLQAYRVVRFMDFQGTNSTWLGSSAADLTHAWADRSLLPQSANVGSLRASLTVGSGNAALTFEGKNYVPSDASPGGATKLAAELPNHWFGPNGNNITVEILAASGAGSVTVTNLHISVVPAAAATTSAQVKTQIQSNLAAFALVDVTAGGDGSGTVGTVATTNLAGGSFGFKREGLSIEDIVEAANQSGCRPWICVPFAADDNYVTQMATYVNANLRAVCRPVIWEYHNEPWNNAAGFVGNKVLEARAIKEGLSPPTALKKQANRHVEVMNLISAVMAPADIVRALGVQSAVPSSSTTLLGYTGVLAATDAIAIAPYFSDSGTSVETTFTNMPANIASTIADASAHKVITDANGIDLIFYEGGQHLSSGNLTHMQSVMRDARMEFYYGQYLSEIARLFPTSEFVHYMESSVINASGAWGLTEYMGETGAPKYDAYVNAIAGIFPAYYRSGFLPTISGVRSVGQVLTISQPTAYNTTSIARQWLRDGVAISGETGTTYTQVLADDTKVIECQVTLTGNAAFSNPAYTTTGSAATSNVFDPASLFTGGEFGFVIDPQNLASLWENSGGTGAVVVGDPVGQANDLSGGGRHMTAPFTNHRPTLQNDGVKNYLSFDGTDDHLDYAGAGVYAAGAATIIVALHGAGQIDRCIFGEGSSTTNSPYYWLRSGNTSNTAVYVSYQNTAGTPILIESSGSKIASLLDSTKTVLTFDDSGSTARLRENGGAWQSQAYTRSATAVNRASLGCLPRIATNLYFTGRIYRIIVIGRQLTAGELSDAEAWVTAGLS